MPNQQPDLDRLFQALADPTRRGMLERLSRGPASVGELAAPLSMALPSVMQHLRLLESSGLVTTHKAGRVRTCHLRPQALSEAERWIRSRRAQWDRQLDRLADYLDETRPPHSTGETP